MNNANYREHRDISLAMKEKPTTILSVDQLNIEFNGFIGSVQNPEIARELKKSWNQTINNYRSLSEGPEAAASQLSQLVGSSGFNLGLKTSQGVALAVTKSAANNTTFNQPTATDISFNASFNKKAANDTTFNQEEAA